MNADKPNPDDSDTHKGHRETECVQKSIRKADPSSLPYLSVLGHLTQWFNSVIHALLVARRRPPNVVLGLSAGAINAVALGEVFAELADWMDK